MAKKERVPKKPAVNEAKVVKIPALENAVAALIADGFDAVQIVGTRPGAGDDGLSVAFAGEGNLLARHAAVRLWQDSLAGKVKGAT